MGCGSITGLPPALIHQFTFIHLDCDWCWESNACCPRTRLESRPLIPEARVLTIMPYFCTCTFCNKTVNISYFRNHDYIQGFEVFFCLVLQLLLFYREVPVAFTTTLSVGVFKFIFLTVNYSWHTNQAC